MYNRRFGSPIAPQQTENCHPENTQVERQGNIANVPEVQRALFCGQQIDAPVYLSPTGNAGANRQSCSGVRRLVSREKWPGSDQRHVADQHVQQLGKFVDACLAKQPTNPRDALFVGYPLSSPIKWGLECSELVNLQLAAILPDALLPE